MPNTTQMITSTALESLSIAINIELGLVICLPCKTAFTTEGIYYHLGKAHQQSRGALTQDVKDGLKEAFTSYRVPDKQYPVLPSNRLYPAFDGLLIHETLGCHLCFQNGGRRNILNHMRDSHPNATIPKDFVHCLGQYVNKGSTKILLRVQKPQEQVQQPQQQQQKQLHGASSDQGAQSTTLPEVDYLQEFQAFHEQSRDLTKATALHARFVSPFLTRTEWYDHVQSYPIPMLQNLVAMPGPSEFTSVIAAIRGYFDEGIELLNIKRTPELVLQRLSSDDPEKL